MTILDSFKVLKLSCNDLEEQKGSEKIRLSEFHIKYANASISSELIEIFTDLISQHYTKYLKKIINKKKKGIIQKI